MTDAPKRIIARIDYDGEIDGQWIDADAPRPHSFGHYFTEYTRADLIDMDVLRMVEAAFRRAVDDLDEWVACQDALEKAGFNMDDTRNRAEDGHAALADLRAMMEKINE